MRTPRTWLVAGAAALAGCSIAVQRDLHGTKPSDVVFDDVCGVQDYYDTLALKKAAPPRVELMNEIESREGKRGRGGRTRYAFETEYQLKMLRKILAENYSHLPQEALTQKPVKLEVIWSEKAGVQRAVTDRDAELIVGDHHWALPPHPCLSELLFSEELYRTRRSMLGLPPLEPAATARAATAAALRADPPGSRPDGGAPDAAR
jgi:hypothetical protein